MSEFIHEIAAEMSPLLLQAEEANEATIAALCNLMAAAATKRREAGVLPAQAHTGFLRLHRALGQTISAQSDVLRFHGKLQDQYRTFAGDDIHGFTVDGVQRSAQIANAGREQRGEVIALRA